MRDISSALYGLESQSMRSRDPDGVGSREMDMVRRLEPSGSRSDDAIPGQEDSVFSGIIMEDTEIDIPVPPQKAFDVAKLVGIPPPPPKNPPPRKKGAKKKEKQVNEKLTEVDQDNDENSDLLNVTSSTGTSSAQSPTPKRQEIKVEENDDDDLLSFITTESNTIDVDDFSLASRSVMSGHSNKLDITVPSPASAMTRLHSNKTNDSVVTEEDQAPLFFSADELHAEKASKDQKRGFFRKLFKGRGKSKPGMGLMDVIAESSSSDSNPAHPKKTSTIQEEDENNFDGVFQGHEVVDLDSDPIIEDKAAVPTSLKASASNQSFSQDPPDDEHGDPPQRSGRPLISPRSAKKKFQTNNGTEEESGRSRIADFYGPADSKDYLIQTIPSTLSVDRSLYGGDISINQRLSIDPEADGEVPRLSSTKARDGKEVKAAAYRDGGQPTPTNDEQLRVLLPTESVDPVGASPKLDSDTRGRAEVEIVFKEPAGQSPLAWKVAHDDPMGASPRHDEELKKVESDEDFTVSRTKSADPPLIAPVKEVRAPKAESYKHPVQKEPVEIIVIDIDDEEEAFDEKQENRSTMQVPVANSETDEIETPENIIDNSFDSVQNEYRSEASRAALDLPKPSVAEVSEQHMVEVGKEIQFVDVNTAMALSVSAAAFSNAETLAYLHELQGQPSPRHSWHVSKRKQDNVPPRKSPMQTQKKTPKEILKAKLREKYSLVQESARKKAPSPDEYTAEYFDDNIERANRLERKNISKFQGFGYQSRFKGRKPTRKDTESDLAKIRQSKTHSNRAPGNEKQVVPYALKVTPGKLTAQAVARVRVTRNNAAALSARQKQLKQKRIEGKNRFRFRIPESEIKDPIQRASRRLLSKAALKIQTTARMYLAKREAVDRMWALLAIQAYSRRWKCEAILRGKVEAIKSVQSVARTWIAKKEIERRNAAAVKIQKTLRGYLAAAKVYDMVYCIVSIQSLMRGAYVRHMKEKRKALFAANAHKAIPMQALVRAFIARKELAARNAAATKMQSLWRMYVAKIDSQMQVVDIIVSQSVVRRWLACRQATAIRNLPYFERVSKIQAVLRGRLGRNHHKKMLAAREIQRVWRGFQAYTDYVFALVDIIVVQRKVRQWLAVRKANALREEKSAKIETAATNIQKTWRGFWAFSQYIIVQYEVTRLQAIVRGKLARENYQFKLGCAIIIQAKVRQHLAKKKLTSDKLDTAMVLSKAEELREKNAAKRIQFWWRIVLEWTKEKKAALVIERFFINVKKEVEREVRRRRRRSSSQRKERRRESQPLPGRSVKSGNNQMVLFDQELLRSQSAPRAGRPPTHRTPTNAGRSRRMPSPSPRHLNKEPQSWPVDSVLQLSESNVSEVSNITTPEVLLRSSTSFDRRQRGQRTATDYIQKYNKAAEMYSSDNKQVRAPPKRSESAAGTAPLADEQSQHFFSDGRVSSSLNEGAAPRTDRKAAAALGQQGRRRSTSGTPRGNRMPPSPHRMPPSPHRLPPSPHRMPPSPHRQSPSHNRMHSSSQRNTPSPHRVASSPRRSTPSPRRERLANLPPVDLSKLGVIKRDETHETDSMSRSTASRSSYADRRNPAEERGYSSKQREFRDQPTPYVGLDYGEV